MNHINYMLNAIQLSMNARITAPPNPWVGCLIVKDHKIIGEGYSQPAGDAHAEVMALKQAGDHASNATAYVSLEPCSHYGRTPPCANALIKAGISQVYIALEDPDSRVKGNGIKMLREAGIEVHVGLCKKEAESALFPYLFQRQHRRPYCVAKTAISLDGKIAAIDGSSQWITCQAAREDVHQLRAESQAILIGSGTALKDRPKLNVRNINIHPIPKPLRVVLDSKGLVTTGPLMDVGLGPTLILTSEGCPQTSMHIWNDHGVEHAVLPSSAQGIDLQKALDLLGQRGILQLLIEGGGGVLSSFLSEKLLQSLIAYIGPKIIGNNGLGAFPSINPDCLAEAVNLSLETVTTVGECVRLNYRLS